MQHKHPNVRKGFQMTSKWNVAYFCKIKLIPSNWLYYNKMYDYKMEDYIERQTQNWKKKTEKRIEKLKQQGKEYYDMSRLKAITFHKQFVIV
jgi:hypothetical protein